VGVGLLMGVFAVKGSLRKRLVSRSEEGGRGRARMELLALRARLRKDGSLAEDPGLMGGGNRAPPAQDERVSGQGPQENPSPPPVGGGAP
jgi:hypothetical protein